MVAESPNPARITKPRLGRISLIRELLNDFRVRMDDELHPLGITMAQLRVLWTIEMSPEASGAEIARHCAVTPQSAQAIIARLEANGWIKRRHSASNDRVLISEPTPAGRKLLMKSRDLAERIDAELWEGASEQSKRAADKLLSTALDRLRNR